MIIKPCNRVEVPMELLLEADPMKDHVIDYINRGDVFVAEEAGEVIGVMVLLPTRPGTLEVVNIAVSGSHRGKGVGSRLLQFAAEAAEGYENMETGTGNSSIGQLLFYQRNGFRIDHVDKDFFIKQYEDDIWENGIQCRDMIRLVKTIE
ncbi:GNAT family N-acetyltransferase [Salimicrobium salexigens]|nr:GNAT family N-acetyltransferase [Salimicrobium salexigens]